MSQGPERGRGAGDYRSRATFLRLGSLRPELEKIRAATLHLDDSAHPATPTARIAMVSGWQNLQRSLRLVQNFLAPRAFFGLAAQVVAGTTAAAGAGVTLAATGAETGAGTAAGTLATGGGVAGVRFEESIGFELIG